MTDAPGPFHAEPADEPADEPAWKRRFRAARVSLPQHAPDAPERCVLASNVTGTFEIYAWDRTDGALRQVTDRPNGTVSAAIDPTGEWIWWFDDTDGDEFGRWRRQPFVSVETEDAATDEQGLPDLPAGYSAGLALGRSGRVVVGLAVDDASSIHLVDASRTDPVEVYRHTEDAHVAALSRDGSLLVIAHSEHGDSRHPALRVLRLRDADNPNGAGAEDVADLWDGKGKGVVGVGFSPVAGDPRLLVLHERTGRSLPLLWDPTTGEEREIAVDLPGEIGAEWFPDARSLLIVHQYEARTQLFRLGLDDDGGELVVIETPRGVVTDAAVRPDGSVEYHWSSAAEPPVIRSTRGGVVLEAPGEPPPTSVPVQDVWVEGPGGRVHALVSEPTDRARTADRPPPAVFLVHGGPEWHDADHFTADSAAWVDHGFTVVRVNYRGSTGYGSAWRDAISPRVGLTELEDIAAVRENLVAAGRIDPQRIVLTGASWGGYLTLLGLGSQPDGWSAGIAHVPVADYVAAYEDEMEGLQAFDRALFGGSPAEVPEAYERSSPVTYVEQVRAPVLVLAGLNDPRCPIRQIDNYLARLAELNRDHEVYRFDAGHGSLVVEERLRQMEVELEFALRRLSPAR